MGLIDQMMANLYKPQKQEKTNTVIPKNLSPAKAANLAKQSPVVQGQFLKGEVLDLRASQILVLLENGITVSARTEGTLELSIGQHAKFFVAQTTEDQILLKLAKEDAPAENPMIDKALTAANISKTERSVSIVTELLNHQQPVNEANIRHYLSLSAKYPDFPVKDLILMELHHIPVTQENVEQFAGYQDRNAKLLTQAQDMVKNISKEITQLPEGPVKQELLQEVTKLIAGDNPELLYITNTLPHTLQSDTPVLSEQSMSKTAQNIPSPDNAVAGTDVNHDIANELQEIPTGTPGTYPTLASDTSAPSDSIHQSLSRTSRTDVEPLFRDLLNSFLLKPEEISDPEKVQKYYEKLNEKLTGLEQLSQKLAENTTEHSVANAPKQMRQNLSFMEAVNNIFPYIQLPLRFKETPVHGELYVYEKKKALKPSDTLSALLHLEMEALGTLDIFVTLAGTHVTTRFSMTDKESGNLIRTELPKLTEALAAKGYTLQSEVMVREPEEENNPTLLEQFLEEHAPGGLNRYTFDIRA